jgi:hypothetical protein
MSMRVLTIVEEAKAKVREVLDFSLREEHWRDPGTNPKSPGDSPRYVTSLENYRCVFSIIRVRDGELFRHLSVSAQGTNYLTPISFYTIAQEFGFTGWDANNINPPKDWSIDLDQEKRCAGAMQRYE